VPGGAQHRTGRIGPDPPQGAPLAQQVPEPVDLDVELLELVLDRRVAPQVRVVLEEVVLDLHEGVDLVEHALIAWFGHGPSVGPCHAGGSWPPGRFGGSTGWDRPPRRRILGT
jgi:hypothetical protein